jgi:hypothetical protein
MVAQIELLQLWIHATRVVLSASDRRHGIRGGQLDSTSVAQQATWACLPVKWPHSRGRIVEQSPLSLATWPQFRCLYIPHRCVVRYATKNGGGNGRRSGRRHETISLALAAQILTRTDNTNDATSTCGKVERWKGGAGIWTNRVNFNFKFEVRKFKYVQSTV